MKARHALFVLTSLLPGLLACTDTFAAPAPVDTPVAVVLSFYRGYVARFRSDHDPLLDLMLEGSPRVSASLLTDLRTRLADDPDPDDDYFLHSPLGVRPYHRVDVEVLRSTTDDATVLVSLGAPRTPSWRVAVSLARDAGAWRIRSVTRDPLPPARKRVARAVSDR